MVVDADEGFRWRVARAGLRYVGTYHDWKVVAKQLEAV